MANVTSYSKLGYLMLKKESPAGTAVYPNTAVEFLSEDIKMNWEFTSSETIAGNRSANLRPILNRVGPAEGTIEMLVEPNTIGHFLNGLMGEDSNTTLSSLISYGHDWNGATNTLVSYTMDVKIAGENYIKRFFGVRIKKITFALDNNKLKATIDVTAQKVFSNARLTVAHATGTTLDLDQTSGLTTSDSLLILDKNDPSTELATLTIVSITSELVLVSSTIAVSLEVDDIVVIKAQTLTSASYSLSNEFIWSGGADVYAFAGANPMQNLVAKTNCESMELTFENELESRWAATGNDVIDRFPAIMLTKGWTVSGKFSQFHINPEFLDMLRKNEQTGLRFAFTGAAIDTNAAAVAATGTIESDGAGTITVTADTAGEDGNDYAVKIVQGTTTLSAALSGKLITVTLDATPANNAVATVASAITALSGVAATSSGAGNVDVTNNPNKIEFNGGRDIAEKAKIRFDILNGRLKPFNANLSSDATVQEDIEFTGFYDTEDKRDCKIRLRNAITDY